jgi:ribonuclease E
VVPPLPPVVTSRQAQALGSQPERHPRASQQLPPEEPPLPLSEPVLAPPLEPLSEPEPVPAVVAPLLEPAVEPLAVEVEPVVPAPVEPAPVEPEVEGPAEVLLAEVEALVVALAEAPVEPEPLTPGSWQTPAMHCCSAPQASQATPPSPQCSALGSSHLPSAWQQPAQVAGPQPVETVGEPQPVPRASSEKSAAAPKTIREDMKETSERYRPRPVALRTAGEVGQSRGR